MKIGILTFHRAHNYGAVLQCYALQQYLIQLGHEVYVIDYNRTQLWAGYSWRDKEYERRIKRNPLKLPFRLYIYLKNRRKQIVRYHKFIEFQEHVLKLAPVNSITEHPYDLILIGSDQVWNISITKGFDPYYWGAFEKTEKTKVATYAASLRKLWNEEDYDTIYNALKKLDGISVREISVGNYVKGLFPDLDVSFVPDPVFLLSAEKWRSLAKLPKYKEPYAFFYQAEKSDSVYNTAKEIAASRNLPLITLSANQWAVNSKECHSSSPQEFLGWLINAKLVITSSFHALAFCIIFQKEFYAVSLNQGQDERLKNIVSLFGLEDRLIDDASQCKDINSFSNEKVLKDFKIQANAYLSSLSKR